MLMSPIIPPFTKKLMDKIPADLNGLKV